MNEPTKENGFVYFVQMGADGPIKIGRARNPLSRLGELQTSNPHALRILLVIKGGDKEKSFHEMFAASRMNGEWFRPDTQILEFIATNSAGHENPETPVRLTKTPKPPRQPSGPRKANCWDKPIRIFGQRYGYDSQDPGEHRSAVICTMRYYLGFKTRDIADDFKTTEEDVERVLLGKNFAGAKNLPLTRNGLASNSDGFSVEKLVL